MYAQRVFNALNAGLSLSSKYPGLFFEDSIQGKKVITYYYNENGQIHNPNGPAIITRDNGVVTDQKFVRNGKDLSALIQQLTESNAIQLIPSDDGEIIFSDADMFTIDMSVDC